MKSQDAAIERTMAERLRLAIKLLKAAGLPVCPTAIREMLRDIDEGRT